jgi:hypothetical protein
VGSDRPGNCICFGRCARFLLLLLLRGLLWGLLGFGLRTLPSLLLVLAWVVSDTCRNRKRLHMHLFHGLLHGLLQGLLHGVLHGLLRKMDCLVMSLLLVLLRRMLH